ncbi:MAG: hypothetical protein WCR45_09470 [Bacteroidaceae bacterium]|nr:hypothetical protein [Bacteroidaceae bacterium]
MNECLDLVDVHLCSAVSNDLTCQFAFSSGNILVLLPFDGSKQLKMALWFLSSQ